MARLRRRSSRSGRGRRLIPPFRSRPTRGERAMATGPCPADPTDSGAPPGPPPRIGAGRAHRPSGVLPALPPGARASRRRQQSGGTPAPPAPAPVGIPPPRGRSGGGWRRPAEAVRAPRLPRSARPSRDTWPLGPTTSSGIVGRGGMGIVLEGPRPVARPAGGHQGARPRAGAGAARVGGSPARPRPRRPSSTSTSSPSTPSTRRPRPALPGHAIRRRQVAAGAARPRRTARGPRDRSASACRPPRRWPPRTPRG